MRTFDAEMEDRLNNELNQPCSPAILYLHKVKKDLQIELTEYQELLTKWYIVSVLTIFVALFMNSNVFSWFMVVVGIGFTCDTKLEISRIQNRLTEMSRYL